MGHHGTPWAKQAQGDLDRWAEVGDDIASVWEASCDATADDADHMLRTHSNKRTQDVPDAMASDDADDVDPVSSVGFAITQTSGCMPLMPIRCL